MRPVKKMSNFKFEAKKRADDEKMLALRNVGTIPAVVYGAGMENINLKISRNDIEKLYKKAGESSMIELVIDAKDSENVLIKKIQIEGIRNTIIHVDFFRPSADKKVIVKVPLVFHGTPKTVKEMGGMLLTNMEMVKVRCLAKDLINSIDIDLNKLEIFADSVRVRDLNISDEVEIMDNPNNVIVSTAIPKVQVEEKVEEPTVDDKKEESSADGEKKEEPAKKEKK